MKCIHVTPMPTVLILSVPFHANVELATQGMERHVMVIILLVQSRRRRFVTHIMFYLRQRGTEDLLPYIVSISNDNIMLANDIMLVDISTSIFFILQMSMSV